MVHGEYTHTMYTNYTKPVVPNLKTNHSPTLEDLEVSGDELSISEKQNRLLSFTYGVNLHFLNIIFLSIYFLHLFNSKTYALSQISSVSLSAE